MPQSLTETVLAHFKQEGLTHVFGIVGGLLHPFFRGIEDDKSITFIHARHEEGAAFMADGFARTSGNPAVVAGTSGPGATNLITGVACAFTDGVPMIVITGNVATGALGKGAAQETNREDIDIVEMFRPITKYSAFVSTPESFTLHFQRAMRAMHEGRKGPVHLNIPVDLWNKPTEATVLSPKNYRAYSEPFDAEEVDSAVSALLKAERPTFLVGSVVASSQAQTQVLFLANKLNARVATTPRAKGVFPEDHPYSLGVFGNAGHKSAQETIFSEDIDVLFTIGTSLGEVSTYSWSPKLRPTKTLIQLDIDPIRIGRNYPVDIPLVGNARSILNHMLDEISHCWQPIGHSKWRKPGDSVELRLFDTELRTSDSVPLAPQRWRADLEGVLPDDAIIFSDIGGHMLFNLHYLILKKQQQFMINLGFGSMGHGTAAPIGAALATNKPVFALVGDGCFTMNGMELITAYQYDIPVIWIVENNNMHGVSYHCSKILDHGKPMASTVNRKGVSISEIAKGMGLETRLVTEPNQMQGAVRELLTLRVPSVIEVITDPNIAPPVAVRSTSLAGFIK